MGGGGGGEPSGYLSADATGVCSLDLFKTSSCFRRATSWQGDRHPRMWAGIQGMSQHPALATHGRRHQSTAMYTHCTVTRSHVISSGQCCSQSLKLHLAHVIHDQSTAMSTLCTVTGSDVIPMDSDIQPLKLHLAHAIDGIHHQSTAMSTLCTVTDSHVIPMDSAAASHSNCIYPCYTRPSPPVHRNVHTLCFVTASDVIPLASDSQSLKLHLLMLYTPVTTSPPQCPHTVYCDCQRCRPLGQCQSLKLHL